MQTNEQLLMQAINNANNAAAATIEVVSTAQDVLAGGVQTTADLSVVLTESDKKLKDLKEQEKIIIASESERKANEEQRIANNTVLLANSAEAKKHGDYAKTQGDYAKAQGDSIVGRFTEDEGSIKRENVHALTGKATGLNCIYRTGNIGYEMEQGVIPVGDASVSFLARFSNQINNNIIGSGNTDYSALSGWGGISGGVNRPMTFNLNNVEIQTSKHAGVYYDLYGSKQQSIIITQSESRMCIYINGELDNSITGFTRTQESYKRYIGKNKDRGSGPLTSIDGCFSLIRIFNYALPPEEVKEFYNNGRPDRIVLKSERRALSVVNGIDNFIGWDGNVNLTENNTVISPKPTFTGGDGALMFNLSDIIRDSRMSITITGIPSGSRFECGSGAIPETDLSIKKDGTYILNAGVVKGFKLYPSGVDYTGIIIRINKLKCIAEYLPSSLTPTQWRDTSGNSNHLTATGAPVLIYTPTYKDEIYAESAPIAKPDFSGQKWYDKKNKRLFIGI